MTPVIELQDLRVKLGRREILQGISCRLGSGGGKAIGLLGPNGAGKSTLILTLLGFHQASGGSARIFGLDCHSQSRDVKARVGYMPENDAFIADMSAVRFLRIMGELSGLRRAWLWKRRTRSCFTSGWERPAIGRWGRIRWA
jgi:ABC-2 type transport system ATP-binding protein